MALTLDPKFMDAVEKLDYRVTVGDVAGQLGLRVDQAEKGLLELASETGGNFQVATTGDLVYVFPKDFQGILRNKYFKLRLAETGRKAWRVIFYLIRLSVGVVLILLIAAVVIAIVAALIAIMTSSKSGDNDRDDRGGGGGIGLPSFNFFYFPNFGQLFSPDYGRRDYDYDRRDHNRRDYNRQETRQLDSDRRNIDRRGNWEREQRSIDYSNQRTTYTSTNRNPSSTSEMNFFEVFFSFLFGDGIANADLEERRWKAIAATIRNNGGAVTAEMIAPYLDELGTQESREEENYMVPVLIRFDGKPEITPDNDIIYCFPQMQATANRTKPQPVAAYLKENLWQFSRASSGQLVMAGGFGVALFILSLVLLGLVQSPAVATLSLYGLIAALPWVGMVYSVLYLLIPTIRFGWLQWRNGLIQARNQKRQNRAAVVNQPSKKLKQKMIAAQQFAANTVITQDQLVYTTEEDLLDQSFSS